MKQILYAVFCATFIGCQTLTPSQQCAISNEVYEGSASLSTPFGVGEHVIHCRVAKTNEEQQTIDQVKPEALAIHKKNQTIMLASGGVVLMLMACIPFLPRLLSK